MLSVQKLRANAVNAQKSTGPQSSTGSASSSKNALRHGLTALSTIVVPQIECAEEFETLLDMLRADLAPRGILEDLFVERIAALFWRLRRVLRFESGAVANRHLQLQTDIGIETKAGWDCRSALTLALRSLLSTPGTRIPQATVKHIIAAFEPILRVGEFATFLCVGESLLWEISEIGDGIDVSSLWEGLQDASARVSLQRGVPSLNLTADAFEYWLGIRRNWDWHNSTIRQVEEAKANAALLLSAEEMSTIDRHETRLRKDLSRTLDDLRSAQHRRIQQEQAEYGCSSLGARAM